MSSVESRPDAVAMNLHAVQEMEERYRRDPESVGAEWRAFFDGFDLGFGTARREPPKSREVCEHCLQKEFQVLQLIDAYRTRGHYFTRTNPVRARRHFEPDLNPSHFGLTPEDQDALFEAGQTIGLGRASLKDIIARLKEVYCRSVGAQYMYIRRPEQVEWLKKRLESGRNQTVFSREEKIRFFEEIASAVQFEQFIGRVFLGQKSFSLEGCESIVVALREMMRHGASLGIKDVRLGMAHRGRLNVLAHVAEKPRANIFAEFLGRVRPEGSHAGDVKYHQGFDNPSVSLGEKTVAVGLAPNPSHLEAVGPVVQGMARARRFDLHEGDASRVVPVVIHGDAAIAGQGVVYETIQMAGLPAYHTGGTIHLVINNQIGFTTNYADSRTSVYCTDVAKVTLSPVFHVNADDVEAVAHTMRLALEFRQRYQQDVFIDLLGYRRHGHNETDEPKYTQPLLYKALSTHPNVMEVYRRKLVAEEGEALAPVLSNIAAARMEQLEREMLQAKTLEVGEYHSLSDVSAKLVEPSPEAFARSPESGATRADLDEAAAVLTEVPASLPVFSKIKKVFEERRRQYHTAQKIDWAFAELLAFGTLLREGHSVRMSGQDVERGTFSQRHAVIMREDTEERHIPLAGLVREGESFKIFNSLLSEFAVLGFEMGYSMERPQGLTVWEAQFGDFGNGAQIIIDNFLSCSRSKWGRHAGLVALLPHGYEGQGAEHSSARLERWLQLCAGLNMQVVYPSTPSSYFHALRRQVRWPWRVPLIVMTPKSLLRNPACVSPREAFLSGAFQEVIDDATVDPSRVRRVILASGKIVYDLEEERGKRGLETVAIVRLEQFYPFPESALAKVLARYPSARLIHAQEEPANMGSQMFLRPRLGSDWRFVSRAESDAPATGVHHIHKQEQAELMRAAFED